METRSGHPCEVDILENLVAARTQHRRTRPASDRFQRSPMCLLQFGAISTDFHSAWDLSRDVDPTQDTDRDADLASDLDTAQRKVPAREFASERECVHASTTLRVTLRDLQR